MESRDYTCSWVLRNVVQKNSIESLQLFHYLFFAFCSDTTSLVLRDILSHSINLQNHNLLILLDRVVWSNACNIPDTHYEIGSWSSKVLK